MLRPQDGPTRERRALDGLWRFVLDPEGSGHTQEWWRAPLPGARDMPVPASYNDIVPDTAVRDHVGDAWYQTRARVPRGWAGQRIVLRFDAATHRAVVWVDEVRVVAHEGGYTPFEADVTDHVTPGGEVRVTVVVNNELTWQSLPPGFVENTPEGRRQRYYHDFFNYAGLHRSVWLYSTPRPFVRDATVTTGLEDATGTIAYDIDVAGDGGVQVAVTLCDAHGVEVAGASGAAGTLTVDDVRPWWPGAGYLYDLRIELADGHGRQVDSYRLSVGVRTVAVDGTRLLINGEPFHFTGFGKHEDAVVRGKGFDAPLMVHDFELMRWVGANSFRTTHYPYAEEVLDYADRHGIVVIDEAPAVGQNLSTGVTGGSALTTFSEDTINAASRRVHAQAIRELINRDRNHPSVVLWSLANEPESVTDQARRYFEPLFALARQLDPTRPVSFANAMAAPPGLCLVSELTDVLLVNRYYGWYRDPGDLAAAERGLEAELTAWAQQGKPIIVAEYGADAVPGLHGIAPMPWTEEYQSDLLAMHHRVFDRIDAVIGEHVWTFADFATGPGVLRVDGNKKGVFTRERRPKAAAHLLRRRWTRQR